MGVPQITEETVFFFLVVSAFIFCAGLVHHFYVIPAARF